MTTTAHPIRLASSASQADAEALIDGMLATIARLHDILQQETELIRAARVEQAAGLVESKIAAAGTYQRELEAIRAAAAVIGRLVPDRTEALRRALAGLQQTVALNLAVIGTAKAVAEDMMRSVANDVGRRDRVQTYAPAGSAPARRPPSAPVSVSRRL